MPRTHEPSIDLVRKFHTTFGHPVAENITVGNQKLRRLRVLLIAQELAEFAAAAGVPMFMEVRPAKPGQSLRPEEEVLNNMVMGTWVAPVESCAEDDETDIVEMADGLGDLDYVVQGANLVFGIPGGLVIEEIHTSNMSKLGSDGKPIYNEDGKVVKGPNFVEPDITKLLQTFDPSKEL